MSSFEIDKAREFSTLKREVSLLSQTKLEQNSTIEDLQQKLLEVESDHQVALGVKNEEILELRTDLEEALQNIETNKDDLQSKLKGMAMTIRDVEEENHRLKSERSRMLRDFDEDMNRVVLENQDLKQELKQVQSSNKRVHSRAVTRQVKDEDCVDAAKASAKDDESYNSLQKKCKKYNKLIHKLRNKISLLEASEENYKIEKDSLRGFVKPEDHQKVQKQLQELQKKHKSFAGVFKQMEENEKVKEMKLEKHEIIERLKNSLDNLEEKSNQFLDETT